MAKKINEATSTDLPIIQRLVNEYGWKVGDTLLYQQSYDIPENLKKDYPSFKKYSPRYYFTRFERRSIGCYRKQSGQRE